MNRIEIAVAMLPWFAENSAARPDATWQQVAVENAFKIADQMLKADHPAEPKKHVLIPARDCRTCARVNPGPNWLCTSVYPCVNTDRYVAGQPVKRWQD